MPGPLSSTTTRKREAPAGAAGAAPSRGLAGLVAVRAGAVVSWISTRMSGRIPASSQASSELSTASLIVVRSAFAGLSNPSRCRFFVKNSLTEISRCREAIDSAVARRLGGAPSGAESSAAGGGVSFFDFGMLVRCFSPAVIRSRASMSRRAGSRERRSLHGAYGWGIVPGRVTWRIRSPRMVLALLTALNLLNYLDRFVLSAVLAPVQDDLHLSKLVAGLLPTIFLIGYFATSPLFGVAGDRFGAAGRHVLIALGVAVWSLATLASGLAAGTVSMLVARAAVGVGEASYGTLAPTVIDEIAPPALESSWMAIFSVAISVGSALGYVVGGAVLHAHGWRSAFFVAGFPGLVAAVLC